MITSITSTVTTTVTTTAVTGSLAAVSTGRVPLVGEATEPVAVGVFTGDALPGSAVTSQFDAAGQGYEVIINPDPASTAVSAIAVGVLIAFMMARELLLTYLEQEDLNPLRRSLNVRLRGFLIASRAPISSLLAIFLILVVDGVLKAL